MKLAQPPPRWLRFGACEDNAWEFLWVYRIEHEGPFTLHPEEIECGEWVSPAELTKRIAADPANYCSAFRMIWKKAIAGGLGRS